MSGTGGTSSAFGPRLDSGLSFYQYDPETQARGESPTPWRSYENNRKDLFRVGFTTTNSLSLSGKNDRGSVRASVTHMKNKLDSSQYRVPTPHGDDFGGSNRFHGLLSINYRTSYTWRKSDNLPTVGYSGNAISYFLALSKPQCRLGTGIATCGCGDRRMSLNCNRSVKTFRIPM